MFKGAGKLFGCVPVLQTVDNATTYGLQGASKVSKS